MELGIRLFLIIPLQVLASEIAKKCKKSPVIEHVVTPCDISDFTFELRSSWFRGLSRKRTGSFLKLAAKAVTSDNKGNLGKLVQFTIARQCQLICAGPLRSAHSGCQAPRVIYKP